MADKPTPPPTSGLSINPPLPSTNISNPGFTPRSSSFPDNIDSEDDDAFDPTPVHSPSGPHYDDLPPSYDEAQQQALQDARNRVPPLNPHHVDFSRMTLEDAAPRYEIPQGAEVHAHRATAEELSQNGSRSVPVQHTQSSENITVGRTGNRHPSPAIARQVDQASQLLTTALEFTRHEPDADVRYAPKLTRPVAIPQNITSSNRKGKARARDETRDVHRGRGETQVPGAWPAASTDTLPSSSGNREGEPAEFLRAYSKALHPHSVRPAEFLDFLDGLNALCAAAGCTPADLIRTPTATSNPNFELVKSYIDATNEGFFAPRGLKVSIQSLASLLDTIKVPDERGQRAGAVTSVLDVETTPAKRAKALHPWIEPLETGVSEPSISALQLKEMASRYKTTPFPSSTTTPYEDRPKAESEKSRLEREYAERDRAAAEHEDPPHSIPGEYPPNTYESGGRGNFPIPLGAPSLGPHGPPGFTPFGPPGHGPHGPPGFGPHGPPGFGMRGPWGAQPRGGWNSNDNGWNALGQSIGKWGEEFGRRMEAWGEQFGKEAEAWGNDIGRRAAGFNSNGYQRGAAGPSSQGAVHLSFSSNIPVPAEGQETGVHRETFSTPSHVAAELDKHASKKTAHKKEYDDAASISSSSSSDSDSDSDSDLDEDDYANEYSKASLAFTERMREINATADASRAKGKKDPASIERERALAIEKAAKDKSSWEDKIEQKRSKRAVMRDFKAQRRDMKREKRQAKRELRSRGLSKKHKEWKELKKSHRERKKALRTERNDVRRQFREARQTEKSERRGRLAEHDAGESVWIVVSNL